MPVYTFSALSSGQAISFDPNADVLNFDQTAISAASLGVAAEGANVRVSVLSGTDAGKSVVLQNVSPLQLATSNVTFANGSALLFGDNSSGTANDNAANTLNGTAGNDLLQGFGGADTLNGGTGNDTYLVGAGDVVNDSGGVDTIVSDISWSLGAAFENLTFTGSANINGAGNDLANLITGNAGANTVWAGRANDTLMGGAGNDHLGGDAGSDWIDGQTGNDTLDGGGDKDHFVLDQVGTANADTIVNFATAWDDIQLDVATFGALGVNGRFAPGDARFFAGAGITGGHDADDRIVYNTSTGQLFYDADGSGSGTAQIIATLQGAPTLVASDLWVFGTPASSGAINGTAGNDTLTGTAGNDTINGLDGNDSIAGLGGNDSLSGGGGNDTLDGGSGIDTLDGGLGDDTFIIDTNSDVIVDAGGIDTLIATNLTSAGLPPGIENLTVREINAGHDDTDVSGNDSNNVIRTETTGLMHYNVFGRGGNDTLIGGTGNETYEFFGNYGSDTVEGGTGRDVIDFASGETPVTVDFRSGAATGGGTGQVAFTNIEAARGTAFGDTSIAGDTGVRLGGLQGNDTITGGAGNDTLEGEGPFEDNPPPTIGAGNDLIFGGGGNDVLSGDDGDDTLSGGLGQDTLQPIGESGPGMDHLLFDVAPGSANADVVFGFQTGHVKVVLDGNVYTNAGASGDFTSIDDRFYSAAGATAGHDANDRVIYDTSTGNLWYDADGSGAGATQLIATLQGAPLVAASDISLINGSAASVINGTADNDTLTGTPGNDTINGLGGNDSLSGLAGSDFLSGGDGNDTMDGGAGADTLDGGLGDDIYLLADADVLSDAGGVDTVVVTDNDGILIWHLADGFENLTLRGTSFFVYAEGNELDNVLRDEGTRASEGALDGRDGNDTLIGGPYFLFTSAAGDYGHDFVDGAGDNGMLFVGDRSAAVVDFRNGTVVGGGEGGTGAIDFVDINHAVGGDFNDQFFAADSGSFAYGNGGDDTFVGGAGADTFSDDDDWAYDGSDEDAGVALGNDDISGGAGNDLIMINRGDDVVNAGDGDDTIDINIGFYFAGDDYTYGNDTINGGTGIDTLSVILVSDVSVDLGAGTMIGGGVNGSGSATLVSIENFDTSRGGAGGHNHIVGSAVGNVLTGFGTNDTLNGAGGNDTLTGGGNADWFVFDQSPGGANADHVTDFTSGADQIHLDAAVMTELGAEGNFAAGDARFWAAADATSGHDADDRVIYNTSTGQLFYDRDGNGASTAQLVATLQSGATLAATDVVVQGAGTPPPGGATEGDDTLIGTEGPDTLDGLGGNDSIVGLGGDDLLIGGDGNDTLDGGLGNNTLDGGDGDDTYIDPLGSITDAAGIDTIIVSDRSSFFLPTGIENLTLTGAPTTEATASGNELDNVIRIEVDTGFRVQVSGGAGDDTLIGGSSLEDYLVGSGHDVVDAGSGSDRLFLPDSDASIVDFRTGSATPLDTSSTWSVTFTGIEQVIGTALDDLIIADDAGRTLRGVAGNDTLVGGAGNDQLYGDMNVDGDESLIGDDSLYGAGGDDRLEGGQGDDTLDGGTGNDVLWAISGADAFLFTAAPGVANADTIEDFVSGLRTILLDADAHPNAGPSGVFAADDERFYAAAGASAGHDATDRVVYNTSTGELWYDVDGSGAQAAQLVATLDGAPSLAATDIEVLNGSSGAGDQHIVGTQADDSLVGGSGNDTIEGLDGLDTLVGGGGNDSLAGGSGWDTVTGGAGQDTFAFAEAGSGMNDSITDFVSGSDKVELDAAFFTAIGASGAFAPGDARFWAAPGATAGHDADDRVVYDTSSGILYYDANGSGSGGEARIAILEGSPTLDATDFVVKGDAPPPPPPGSIDGTAGNDSLVGTSGDDTINGLDGNDTLRGLDGNDVLDGGPGTDLLDGGLGDDTYFVTSGDSLTDVGGVDTIISGINWSLGAGFENLTLSGIADLRGAGNDLANLITQNAGNNVTWAGRGNDTVLGGGGNDLLGGDAGNDWLNGQAGNDTLDGGGDKDHFVFSNYGAADADTVRSFATAWDDLRFDSAAFAALGGPGTFAAGDGRFYAASGASGGHDANDRLVYNSSTGQLYYDDDGSGGHPAQLVATLEGAPTLAASDITVI